MAKKKDRNQEVFKQVKVDPTKETYDGYDNKIAPANYDKVDTDGTTLTSKSENKTNKRGSSYQGNPTDPFENHVKSVVEKTKPSKKKTAPLKKKEKGLNRRSRPEPTPDLQGTETKEDG